MMNVSSPIPWPSIWRGKSPALADLGVLLDFVSDPALILDKAHGSIILASSSFLTFSAYSSTDLIGHPIQKFFQDPFEASLTTGEEPIVKFLRKHRSPIDVKVSVSPIDNSGQWVLLKFQQVQHQLQWNWHEVFMNGMIELSRLAGIGNLQNSLEQAVQILHNILGQEMVGVYQAEGNFPRLRLAAAFDPGLILPETLPSSDLIRLTTTTIWFQGKRVTTDLYRNCRVKDVSYLASTPLGQEGAWLGLLVVGDRQTQPINHLSQLMSVVGTILNTAIEHNILVTNQQNMIEMQDQALSIRNVLAEHVREGVVVLGPDLNIREINPVAEVMLGYTDKEARNHPVESILIGSKRLIPALNSALEGVAIHNLGDAMLHHRDGRAFPAMIETIPVEKDNLVQAILIVITDISADEQIKVRTQQLEQRAVIGEVIQAFAHEVRNPINNISLTLEAMAGLLSPDDPNQDFVSRMQSDCFRLGHLMESILASAKPLEPRFERIELQFLLRKIIERWRPRLAKVNVSPFFQMEPNVPPIKGDPRSLEQVFSNLISNAVDAMSKHGGGTLAIKLAPLNTIPNLPQVEVTVTDDGPGIPDEILEHIFEPFVSNNPRGTGLGLAITKQIVTAHRGSVQADTFPGGTVFQVVLPAYSEEE